MIIQFINNKAQKKFKWFSNYNKYKKYLNNYSFEEITQINEFFQYIKIIKHKGDLFSSHFDVKRIKKETNQKLYRYKFKTKRINFILSKHNSHYELKLLFLGDKKDSKY